MAYTTDLGIFAGSVPSLKVSRLSAPRSSSAFAAWRSLDSDTRLKLVQDAINCAAGSRLDGERPIAL